MLLQGKKALILGLANNRSIAYGIAAALKAQGARLAFNYVGDAIKKRVEPLSEELGGEFTFQCDVCDDGQIDDAAALVKEKWGDLDILVHSVAFANREDLSGRFVDTSRDGFKLALEVSAYSLTALCRAFEPLMTENASVLSMTYHGSTQVIPGYNVMGVAKAALEASVRYLAYDLGPKGVRVNAICPGLIETGMTQAIFDGARARGNEDKIGQLNPMTRGGVPIEIANAALFLASDESSYVNGQAIVVDGGLSSSHPVVRRKK